jgi:DNA-directed RNA polymerase specialized sigma24 family protein
MQWALRRYLAGLAGSADGDDLLQDAIRPSGEELLQLLAIAEVSPASRAVLMLHFQEDLPIAEVAAILDIPLTVMTKRILRAIELASRRRSASTSVPRCTRSA